MTLQYSPKNNPRVIVIQKLYGKYFNEDENLTFPKHRFKKFIKDVVNGTIERDDVIKDEILNHLNEDLNLSVKTVLGILHSERMKRIRQIGLGEFVRSISLDIFS